MSITLQQLREKVEERFGKMNQELLSRMDKGAAEELRAYIAARELGIKTNTKFVPPSLSTIN